MDDYISKPIKPNKLKEALDKWLPSHSNIKNETQEDHMPDSELEPQKTPMAEASELPIFEFETVLNRMMDDMDLLQTVIEAFLGDMEIQVKHLRQEIENKDSVGIAASAHKIKGASSNVSALRFSSYAQQIEHLASEGNFELIEQNFKLLEDSVEPLKNEIADKLKS